MLTGPTIQTQEKVCYCNVDRIFWLLSGLNQDYADVKAQLQRTPPETLEDTLAVLRIANQELLRNEPPPIALNATNRRRIFKNPLPNRHQSQRNQQHSRKKSSKECGYCHKPNHTEEECRKKKRDNKPSLNSIPMFNEEFSLRS